MRLSDTAIVLGVAGVIVAAGILMGLTTFGNLPKHVRWIIVAVLDFGVIGLLTVGLAAICFSTFESWAHGGWTASDAYAALVIVFGGITLGRMIPRLRTDISNVRNAWLERAMS